MRREFLVTKFVCAACGSNLQLACGAPPSAGRHAEGEPTGAAMVQQVVAVMPCDCTTRPLEEMRQAARVLLGA